MSYNLSLCHTYQPLIAVFIALCPSNRSQFLLKYDRSRDMPIYGIDMSRDMPIFGINRSLAMPKYGIDMSRGDWYFKLITKVPHDYTCLFVLLVVKTGRHSRQDVELYCVPSSPRFGETLKVLLNEKLTIYIYLLKSRL